MRLVIVRHGKAKPDSPTGLDFDRDLRPRGLRQAAYIAERLSGVEPRPARVVTSDAVRARRTAEVVADGLGLGLETDDRLLVDEPVSGVLDLLYGARGDASLVIVGHNPQLERLVAVLGGGPVAMAAPLRTGEAVLMEIDPTQPMESGAELDRIRLEEPE
jgi:phosphohistidine phosphatase